MSKNEIFVSYDENMVYSDVLLLEFWENDRNKRYCRIEEKRLTNLGLYFYDNNTSLRWSNNLSMLKNGHIHYGFKKIVFAKILRKEDFIENKKLNKFIYELPPRKIDDIFLKSGIKTYSNLHPLFVQLSHEFSYSPLDTNIVFNFQDMNYLDYLCKRFEDRVSEILQQI